MRPSAEEKSLWAHKNAPKMRVEADNKSVTMVESKFRGQRLVFAVILK